MNFYASRGYLDAAAEVYFAGRDVAVEDVRIGSDILRLLVVDGHKPLTSLQFLDYHQPLNETEVQGPVREGRYARNVATQTIERSAWAPDKFPNAILAPYIDWSLFPSFEAYKEQLLQHHRRLVRDRERRGRSLASNHGELVFTMDDRQDDVFPCARQWKSEQLLQTGKSDYFLEPKTMEFLEALRARDLLVSSTLRAGGRLVSVWIGFVHEGCWSGWVFTYDPAFRKYSAGHQLLNCMLEESYRLGHREFDFSEGGEEYKMLYATHFRLLEEIGRPPLSRSVVRFAKDALRQRSPKSLEVVQGMKKAVGWQLTRCATSLRAMKSGLRAVPPQSAGS